jgi:GT2 family glycosyltransferase
VEVLQREHPDVTVLHGQGELWWGGAMRLGIEHVLATSESDEDLVLMMNNDTEVDPSYVDTLVRVSRVEHAVVGSVVVDSRDPARILDAGEFVDWRTYSFPIRTEIDPSEPFFDGVDVLPGRGTLVPLRFVRVAGNVDDRMFPHYLADYEFFQRLRRHGFRLGVSAQARVTAHISETGFYTVGGTIDIRQAWMLVSSRKSMNNFLDHWQFIGHCAPDGYKTSSRVRLIGRTLRILLLQTELRFVVWPLLLPYRWLRFLAYDHYYVTASDCSRLGLDPARLAEERILSPWLRADWYRFSGSRKELRRIRPELRKLYRCAWNPSTKIQRWVKARAYRAEQREAA